MDNLIVHKIVKYLKQPRIAKIFFYFPDYRRLINTYNSHFDELFDLYNFKIWIELINNLRSVQSMFRKKDVYVNGYRINAIDYAARVGNLEVIKWLHNNCDAQDICTTWAMNWAASYGHLEVVKWLHENRKEGCTNHAMDYAAENGHLEVVKWLHVNRAEGCTVWAINFAVDKGHLDVVKWLYENRQEEIYVKDVHVIDNAAAKGHLEMIKWLHELFSLNHKEGLTTSGNICTTNAMDWAASNGHLEVVKWLHENRKEGCTSYAIHWATQNDHFEVVQ